MRFCLIARRFYESNSHMQQFARILASRGDTVDVLAARRPGSPAFEECCGINVYRIHTRHANEHGRLRYLFNVLCFLCRAAMCVARRHFTNPYDAIHVQSIPDFLVFSALIPKLCHVPIILDLRDLVPELTESKFRISDKSWIAGLLRILERWSARFADHVIVANPIWYERVVRRSVDRAKCSMIWYSPDRSVFRRKENMIAKRAFVIMYPGTLSWHQGVDIAIRAFPKIRKAIPEAELHIYAEGNAKEWLAQLASQLEVADAVRFFNFLPTRALVERMAQCDIAVVPKRASDKFGNEAASTKIPEFLAVGIPVVTSRTAIETRFFNDSELCFFRSEDEDDLVRAVLSLHDNPALREGLAMNGRRRVDETADQVRVDYLGLVDSLTGRRAATTESLLHLVER